MLYQPHGMAHAGLLGAAKAGRAQPAQAPPPATTGGESFGADASGNIAAKRLVCSLAATQSNQTG